MIDTVYGIAWSHDELVLALYLYCQIPFAQTKASNPEVIKLASVLGRTPSSVARKLGNFGAFDPLLAQRGITGLVHYSKADRAVWEEFRENWDSLVDESRRLLSLKETEPYLASNQTELPTHPEPVFSAPTGPTEQPRLVMTRLYQSLMLRRHLSVCLYPRFSSGRLVSWTSLCSTCTPIT